MVLEYTELLTLIECSLFRMRYILQCMLTGPVVPYQIGLINAIADRFDLRWTQRQALAPHFTVKYWFETNDIDQIESILDRFCIAHGPTPVTIGRIGSFPPNVIFLNVELSAEARETFRALIRELQTLPWMQWHEYDGERLHFHATIAEQCGSQYASVMEFLRDETQYFPCAIAHITVLQQTGVQDGIDHWSIHRTYNFMAHALADDSGHLDRRDP
jgi:2'-5' RNA ligase